MNDLSQLAAIAALEDQEFLETTLKNNREGIAQLAKAFDELGLSYMGLHSNFITVKVGDGAKIVGELLKKGIIVRKMNSYDLPEWIRVTVGTKEQNERFLEELKELL